MTRTAASSPARALVVSGAGRYSDPWHPFAETSNALASVLESSGLSVHITEDVDGALADLDQVDLLVVNIGAPHDADADADAAVRAGVLTYLERGGPTLVQHVSVTSLPGLREWEAIVGGTWVQGTTMHPDLDLAHIRVHSGRHPIVTGLEDFDVEDERYTYLRVARDVVPLLAHEHEDGEYPLLWARQYDDARVVYDALGHDARSFRSAAHRQVLRNSIDWLLRREP